MERNNKKTQVLDHNPMINREIVKKHEYLEKELIALGIDTAPRRAVGYKPKGISLYDFFPKSQNED